MGTVAPGTLQPMPDIQNADTVVPLLIIGVCALLMILFWAFTRSPRSAKDLTPVLAAQEPIAGQTTVTQAQLGVWHRAHGETVQLWIENHEDLLKRVSADGLAINLDASLTAGHERLGPLIDAAVEQHPAPQMRAQLSALVIACRGTIEALRRSNWASAEKEHLAYLEYRDPWLDRLRQFTTAEQQNQQIRNIAASQDALPDLLDREDTRPG